MLDEDERRALLAAARNGETGFALEVMRHLARSERLAEIPLIVLLFSGAVEINGAPVRDFLARRVPAILVNHYFPLVLRGRAASTYQEFIHWSARTERWSQPLIDAARSGDSEAFVVAIETIVTTIDRARTTTLGTS